MRPLPIHTTSLALRHFVLADAPVLQRLNGEESTRRWLPSHVYADLSHARDAVGFLIRCYSLPGDARQGPYVLGVERRDGAELLGHVGFSPLNGDVEVSYAIAEAFRGRGYGAEALREACGWAADAFALPRLIANTAAGNAASRRLLERTGFVHRGDESRRFQGSEQAVSRYVWCPASSGVATVRS